MRTTNASAAALRKFWPALCAGVCLASTAWADGGASTVRPSSVYIDIPAQDLSTALTQFGRETGTEIVFVPDAVRQKSASPVKGTYERERAVALLLSGTCC